MKRLMSKTARSVREAFRIKRLMRIAEWVDVDVNDPGLVQQITDIMAGGGQIQIQYKGEWKLISPYGWNSSQEGNVLLMCYKDTGEVRSYRLDRIEAVQVDSAQVDQNAIDNPVSDMDSQTTDSEFDVPETDEDSIEVQHEQELPFDEHIDILEEETVELPIEPQEETPVAEQEINEEEVEK